MLSKHACTQAYPRPLSLTQGYRTPKCRQLWTVHAQSDIQISSLSCALARLSQGCHDPLLCLQAQAHFPVQDLGWVSLQLDALGQECVARLQQEGALPGSLQVRGEAAACIHNQFFAVRFVQLLESSTLAGTSFYSKGSLKTAANIRVKAFDK